MARQRRNLGKSDWAFLRMVIYMAQEIMQLRRMVDRRIADLRKLIIKWIATALIRRYRSYHKGMKDAPSFFAWIAGKNMEETYEKHSYETRLYWASRPILAARHVALSLVAVEGDDSWYYEALTEELNRLMPDEWWTILVVPTTAKVQGYEGTPTLMFHVDELEYEDGAFYAVVALAA